MKRILKLFLLPLLLCLTAAAQTTYAQGGGSPRYNEIRFERFTTKQGLSGNWIRGGIMQDWPGFLWIATSEGLNRYDGYDFKVYRHDEDNPNSLSHNSIRVVAKDTNGIIWLATKGGLNKFDPATETFTHYTHNPDDPTTLGDNDVRKIIIDRTGIIWLGAPEAGLNRFDPTTETFTRYQHDPNDPASLGGNNIRAILADSAGTLWVGVRNGGLHRFDPSTSSGQAPATESFIRYRHNLDTPPTALAMIRSRPSMKTPTASCGWALKPVA